MFLSPRTAFLFSFFLLSFGVSSQSNFDPNAVLESNEELYEQSKAHVFRVYDGDSFKARFTEGPFEEETWEIRIQGVDAPEGCQSHGPESRDILNNLIQGKEVLILSARENPYINDGRRILAQSVQLELNEESAFPECTGKIGTPLEVNQYLLCTGAAWYNTHYERQYPARAIPRWRQAAHIGQKNKRGLWNVEKFGAPIRPYLWRRHLKELEEKN